MSYVPGDAYFAFFTTQTPDGAATDADAAPVPTASRNGVDDPGFELTVLNIGTGIYMVAGTVPAEYVRGDVVSVRVTASVAGTAGAAVVDTFILDSRRVGDLTDADGSAALADIKTILQAGRRS